MSNDTSRHMYMSYKIDARVTCPMATINNNQASNINTISLEDKRQQQHAQILLIYP